MAKPARILLINYSQTLDVEIAVETTDSIEYRELSPTPPDGPAKPLKDKVKKLTVSAGRLFGFATQGLNLVGGSDPFATQKFSIAGSVPEVIVGIAQKDGPVLQDLQDLKVRDGRAFVLIVRGAVVGAAAVEAAAVGGGRDPWPQPPPPPPPAFKGSAEQFGKLFADFLKISEEL